MENHSLQNLQRKTTSPRQAGPLGAAFYRGIGMLPRVTNKHRIQKHPPNPQKATNPKNKHQNNTTKNPQPKNKTNTPPTNTQPSNQKPHKH